MADFPAWAWSKSKAAQCPEYQVAVDKWLRLKAQYKSLNKGLLGIKFGDAAKSIVDQARRAENEGKAAWDRYTIVLKQKKIAEGPQQGVVAKTMDFLVGGQVFDANSTPSAVPQTYPMATPTDTPSDANALSSWMYVGLGVAVLAGVSGLAYYYYYVK